MSVGKQNINILRSASQALTLNEKQSQQLANVLNILERATEGERTDLEFLKQELDKSNISMREFAENVELAYSGLRVMKEQAETNAHALTNVQQAIQANSGMSQGIASGQATQETASTIVNMIGSVGQLAFAWQSFQHLGSL